MTATIIHGNNLNILPTLDDCSIDAIVTDPPYELGFMGKRWDASGIAYNITLWQECLRVLKPGGHLLAFGGTRTYHRMACAIEDAGFEIRDSIHWLYGSGFPKSLDVSKAIDKQAGAERDRVPYVGGIASGSGNYGGGGKVHVGTKVADTPATEQAKQWAGWGTALKPAHEPIVVARKPLIGTVAQNVLEFGTGAINIDGSRIEGYWKPVPPSAKGGKSGGIMGKPVPGKGGEAHQLGRWPANVILGHHEDCDTECVDGCAVAELDKQSGKVGNNWKTNYGQKYAEEQRQYGGGSFGGGGYRNAATYADSGGASRFFYCAKPSRRERNAGLNMCRCDKLLAWENEDQTAQRQADTAQSAKKATDASGTPINSDTGWNTTSSGNSTTDESRQDSKSTIATTTNSTTTSTTSNSSMPRHTNDSTPDANSETAFGGSHAKSVENSNPSANSIGISASNAGLSTGDADPAISGSSSNQSALGSLACPKCDGIKGGHPTVKPLALMRYLVRLVTPPNGTVLEPFAGSGTTLMAATLEGFNAIGIEMTDEYLPIIEGRIAWAENEAANTPDQQELDL